MKFLILIPARYDSSRFPGKLLKKIKEKAILDYVQENVLNSGFDYAFVAGDDEIFNYCSSKGFNVVKVYDDVESGSDRISIAFQRYYQDKGYSFIINVQADEPLLTSNEISNLAQFHETNDYFDIVTIVKERSSLLKSFGDRNVVKAIYSPISSRCMYFSRNEVPCSRDSLKEFSWYQHIGVYSYKADKLLEFYNIKESHYESLEKLEQLKALEFGMSIGAIPTLKNLVGVDTVEDINKVEELLNEK